MDVDSILAENAALKRKLQSKTEALLILNQELIKVKREREESNYQQELSSIDRTTECLGCRQLAEQKQVNKRLVYQIEDLKQRLEIAEGDIEVLRKERRNSEGKDGGNWHGREALVESLETATARAKQLECDLATVLDEKQELVSERDAYRCKVHRLNHQIGTLLKSPQIDIDCLVMENKYLQERLDQSIADKEILQQNVSKYKAMLDKKRNKGTVQLGTSASFEGMIVSHKQVQDLLDSSKLNNTEATLTDLRALCLALLESLQDKSLALAHHKKTNKVLAGRIADLEALMNKDSDRPLFPSRLLMEGFSNSNVDKDVQRITKEDICDNSIKFQEIKKPSLREVKRDESKDSESFLPPDLQELVKKALQDIKQNGFASESQ